MSRSVEDDDRPVDRRGASTAATIILSRVATFATVLLPRVPAVSRSSFAFATDTEAKCPSSHLDKKEAVLHARDIAGHTRPDRAGRRGRKIIPSAIRFRFRVIASENFEIGDMTLRVVVADLR